MAFTEDLDDFINEDTPGYKVLLINYENVAGIFDQDYVESGFVETSDPVFITKTSNIPDIEQDLPVVDEVTDKEYTVVGVEPDGTGLTKLELKLKWDM
jgi:hypothetical protein